MSITLFTHVGAGLVAIVAGYVALSAAKGGLLHRRSGMVFVFTMAVMTAMGAWMAVSHHKSPETNVPAALLTAYLVATGLTTVRPPKAMRRELDLGLALVGLSIGLVDVAFGLQAVSMPRGGLNGMPTAPFFVFGAVAVLASAGDFRLIRSGGTQIVRGSSRLTRHLWRMCVAHLIAAFSFFLGQAKVFPKPVRTLPLLLIPPLIVLVALLYWLWRVKSRRGARTMVATRAPKLA